MGKVERKRSEKTPKSKKIKRKLRNPARNNENTVSQSDARLLGVDVVENALVPDLAFGCQTNQAPDVGIGRRARSRSFHRHGSRACEEREAKGFRERKRIAEGGERARETDGVFGFGFLLTALKEVR